MISAISAKSPDEMIYHDNKAVVLDYVNAFNRGDLDGVCRTFAPNAVIHGVLGSGGLDIARPIWEQLITCFQMKLELEFMIQEEDVVAARFTEHGVFSAPYRGIAPTGRSYQITAMEWYTLQNGRMIERWGARDSAAMFRQMGIPLA